MDVQLAEKPRQRAGLSIDRDVLEKLAERLGRVHARQRLGIEGEREGRVFGQGINFFHPENWYLSASVIRAALMATGLYWRARRNAENIKIRRHDICSPQVPGLEEIGIRMLLNESEAIERAGEQIHLVGIDDAHYYRVDNIEKAVSSVPAANFSILLSHTPEIYRQAAHAGFKLLLSGHTHGGQICLPGAIPIILDSVLPRRLGAGAWTHRGMVGYTSVGVGSCILPVRLNCPPEITLHRLLRSTQ